MSSYSYVDGDYVVPRIHVENRTLPINREVNKGGRVAIIGAFPTDKNTIGSYPSLRDLREDCNIIPGTTNETEFQGAKAAARIFMEGIDDCKGASEVIVCNYATPTEGVTLHIVKTDSETGLTYSEPNPVTADKFELDLTFDKLSQCLSKLKGEDIDLLFVADTLEDDAGEDGKTKLEKFELIKGFLSDEFELQRPTQLYMPLKTALPEAASSSTTSMDAKTIKLSEAYEIVELFKNNPFLFVGCCWQTLTLGIKQELDLIESAAHMCGWIASIPVYESITRKEIPGVTDVEEEVYFGTSDAGYLLSKNGIHVIRSKSRSNNTYCVNNGMLPCQYDIAHVRSISYLIKQYELEEMLGSSNSATSLESFRASLNSVNKKVMDTMNIFNSINTDDIEKISPNEIQVNLKVDLAGIIIVIDLGVNMEVS